MMKFNLDVCTTRRVSGWIFNVDTESPVENLYICSGDKKFEITLIERPDVAAAFALSHSKSGIQINIPDIFDGTVEDYKIYFQDQEIFSYHSQLEKLSNATEQKTSEPAPEKERVDYKQGKHIIFFYSNEDQANDLKAFETPAVRRSFPQKIAGCEFSFEHIDHLSEIKAALLENVKQIMLVVDSSHYKQIFQTSPSLIDSAKFVTLYGEGALHSRTGLHNHQLNNFILNKTHISSDLSPRKSSIARVWAAVENYANLIFSTTQDLFFIVSSRGPYDDAVNRFVSSKIQKKRSDDIIRIRSNESELVILNIASYSKLFDAINDANCWEIAIKRGLIHSDIVI